MASEKISTRVNRREVLRKAAIVGAGLLVPSSVYSAIPSVAAPVVKKEHKAKSVIQVFLWGGMSHNDTWDPKPDSGYEYMNDVRAIPTNVPGIQLSHWFPRLAKQMDKFSLIRSMTHRNNGHETAAYLMQTGHTPGERLAYPGIGAIFALMKKEYRGMLPPYIVMTQAAGRFSEEGFLGPRYKPFATGSDPNNQRFEVEGVVSRSISDNRQRSRRDLLDKLNIIGNGLAEDPTIKNAEEEKKLAYGLILGKGKEVFDLSMESMSLRDKYGRNTFGQECLAARRMAEAGVPYVVINYPGGWDTHSGHFNTMARQCPQLDQGLATLFEDLKDRGMLNSTLVWCTGEFGRTVKVSWEPPWNGGRHHYGNVFSVLVAGGGFKGGQIVGASDAKGEEVKDRPVYPYDLLASIYELAGIDYNTKLPHPWGLEAYILPPKEEVKSAGLLREIM
jgi:uncharacterized protein (DUF1501 family)